MIRKILWLGRIIPAPFNAGDRVYSANLAGAVARQGADVVYLGLENPDEPDEGMAELEPRVHWRTVPGAAHSRLRSLFSPLPMVGARFATGRYRDAIRRELETTDFDVVIFDQYGMSWAVELVRTHARNRPILVQLAHNFETAVNEQIYRNYEGDLVRKRLLRHNALKTRRAEEHLARTCDLLVTLTEEDRSQFRSLCPALPGIVLPPGYAGQRLPLRTFDAGTPRRAVIIGSFRWIAKQINLERLLSAASTRFPQHGIELRIIGFVPEAFRLRMSARFPWAVFRGFVDDIGEECRNARIALIPEEVGGGFKLKTLDYIFSRVPVASVEAALAGIPRPLKSCFIVERDIDALMDTVVHAIDDIDRLDMMQKEAFALAAEVFDWDANGRRLLAALPEAPAAQFAAAG